MAKQLEDYHGKAAAVLSTDPLSWWKQNEREFPLLAKVAAQTLVVQGTSVPSERIFSLCGNTVTDKRSTLTGEHVNHIVFLNKNQCLL